MQWCERLINGHIPLANEFLPRHRQRTIPQWYRDLLERARDHDKSGEAPEFEFASKPHKRWGWQVPQQVLDELYNSVDTQGLAEQDLASTSESDSSEHSNS
jgi:hypothetical protein